MSCLNENARTMTCIIFPLHIKVNIEVEIGGINLNRVEVKSGNGDGEIIRYLRNLVKLQKRGGRKRSKFSYFGVRLNDIVLICLIN